MNWIFFAVLGYLSGSVLYSYYLPLWIKKVDVTEGAADGNPGAYNCFAKAGKPLGTVSLLLDGLKGLLPVLWCVQTMGMDRWELAVVMAAPVLGHAFPIFRRFRGGKAITATFGVLLGLLPEWKPLALLVVIYLCFCLVIRVKPNRTRSIVTFLCFGAGAAVLFRAAPMTLGCVAASAIVLLRHLITKPEESKSSVRFLPVIRK